MPKFSITVKFQGYEFMAQQFLQLNVLLQNLLQAMCCYQERTRLTEIFKHAMDQIRS